LRGYSFSAGFSALVRAKIQETKGVEDCPYILRKFVLHTNFLTYFVVTYKKTCSKYLPHPLSRHFHKLDRHDQQQLLGRNAPLFVQLQLATCLLAPDHSVLAKRPRLASTDLDETLLTKKLWMKNYRQGSILQNPVSAEKISDKFSSSKFGQISTQKQRMYITEYYGQ
jgi:hypothetical protein